MRSVGCRNEQQALLVLEGSGIKMNAHALGEVEAVVRGHRDAVCVDVGSMLVVCVGGGEKTQRG